MTRRTRAVAALLAAPALAGCATFSGNDAAATVEGGEVSRERFEDLLRVFSDNAELTGIQADLDTASVAGDVGRQWLTALVVDQANVEFLAGYGEAISDADRQAVLDGVQEGDPVLDFPDDALTFLVDTRAGQTARSRVPAPDPAEVEARYAEDPASTGVVCLRHILLETEADAEEVLGELRAGGDFDALARERSIEPAAADTGGALPGQDGGACQPLSEAVQAYDPEFVAGALRARPGSPVGPVETQFGWHVIEARPYADVGESIEALYEQAAGELLFSAYLLSADVSVDPRYGAWDRTTRRVVPLGSS